MNFSYFILIYRGIVNRNVVIHSFEQYIVCKYVIYYSPHS